jgi:hypothetical protein
VCAAWPEVAAEASSKVIEEIRPVSRTSQQSLNTLAATKRVHFDCIIPAWQGTFGFSRGSEMLPRGATGSAVVQFSGKRGETKLPAHPNGSRRSRPRMRILSRSRRELTMCFREIC